MTPSSGMSASGKPTAAAEAVADAPKSQEQIEDEAIFEDSEMPNFETASARPDGPAQQVLDSQLGQDRTMVNPSNQPALPAGPSAVAYQSADYFTSQSAPNADCSTAGNPAANDQTQGGPESQGGISNIANVKNILGAVGEGLPEEKEDAEEFQPVRRRNRRQGQAQGRGQFQGETQPPIVASYNPESVQKAKARIEELKRKRAQPLDTEMPVAKRPSVQPTDGNVHRLDSAEPAPQGYKIKRAIRAALKVGNLEVIGNVLKTTKNYSVKVTFDGRRNGQASISLRFRINKSSHVEAREVSLSDSDVWDFYLQFNLSTSGRQQPAIQQFEYSFVDKANPKSDTEQALIEECGERELNGFTWINLEVLRVYNERGEPPSMQELENSITNRDLLRSLQALLTGLQAPLTLQIWFLWRQHGMTKETFFKHMQDLFDTKMS